MYKFIVSMLSMTSVSLSAVPSGETIQTGKARLVQHDKTLVIQQSTEKAIIDWKDFSINQDEAVIFKQPGDLSSVLNRVTGTNRSVINGMLESNGKVFLINENGVLISSKAILFTNGFFASTYNISNDAFNNGKLRFIGNGSKEIINKGKVDVAQGDIVFIAKSVKNEGTLKGKVVALVGSTDVTLYDENNSIGIRYYGEGKVSNTGNIEAARIDLISAGGNSSALAINQSGILHAEGFVEKEGEVFLKANNGKVEINGEITATRNYVQDGKQFLKGGSLKIQGENIHIGKKAIIDISGENGGGIAYIGGGERGNDPSIRNASIVTMDQGAVIRANATVNGDGGRVVLWADQKNAFYGDIFIQGGLEGGDGGFAEISSRENLIPKGAVTAESPKGAWGDVRWDPPNVTLSTAATSSGVSLSSDPATLPSQLSVNISKTDLMNQLALANVTIQTTATPDPGGAGNISISNEGTPITWATSTKLSLIADGKITIQDDITNTYAGAADWTAMDFQANTAESASSAFSGIEINNASLTANTGSIHLQGAGSTDGAITTNLHGIYVHSGSQISVQNADIVLNGTGAEGTTNNYGVFIDGATTSISAAGGTIQATGVGQGSGNTNIGILVNNAQISATGSASLSMTGTGGGVSGASYNNGVVIQADGVLSSQTGAINLSGIGGSGTSNNMGVVIDATGSTGTMGADSTSGVINLTGKSLASGSNNFGIQIKGANATIGGAANASAFTFTADAMSFDGLGLIQSIGSLVLQPFQSSSSIGLGGLSAPTGTLQLTDSDLSNFSSNVSQLVIGNSAGSHTVTTDDISMSAPLTIRGDSITTSLSKTINIGGANPLIFYIGQVNNGTLNHSSAVTASAFTIYGSSNNDTFNFNVPVATIGMASIINGMGGNNTLQSPASNNNFFIFTSPDTNSLDQSFPATANAIAFSNIQNLVGNDQVDTFLFSGNNVDQFTSIDGGEGSILSPNILSFVNYTDAISINLNNQSVAETSSGTPLVNSFSNIQSIVGNYPAVNLNIIGVNAEASTYTINDFGDGNFDDTILFTNIANIIGGDDNDTIIFQPSGEMNSIDGGGGDNELITPDFPATHDTTWDISEENGGTVSWFGLSSALSISNIQNMTGSNQNDTFAMQPESSVDGIVDGKTGTNTLDYSAFTTPALVKLSTGQASNLGGFKNIQNVIGNYVEVLAQLFPTVNVQAFFSSINNLGITENNMFNLINIGVFENSYLFQNLWLGSYQNTETAASPLPMHWEDFQQTFTQTTQDVVPNILQDKGDLEESRREPSPESRREPSPESRREPSPESRREPSPESRREPSPESRREPSPESRREPSPESRREPSPESRKELQEESRREPSPESRREPSPESRREPSPESRRELPEEFPSID